MSDNKADHDKKPLDFIRARVENDLAAGKNDKRVATRFPPEPNGYLHIGHAKSIVLNFGVAREYDGTCNLRFDDTNPAKEEVEYEDSIKGDVRWLGYDWQERLYHASDYFDRLYDYALDLIRAGKAYVDSQSAEEIRRNRGTLTEPGTPSPYRGRTVEENLELFQDMKDGKYKDGEHVLRAKIDMTSPNLNMRDPVIYRIRHMAHHRTGDKWCIYPMYDFTHCLSDALEGITHSLCTLEFEDNRALYDWVLDQVELPTPVRPQQIEFARLSLTYTILSKRKLLQLVKEGKVDGWDDPRMPTLSGLRRRGYTPEAIVDFCERIGVAKRDAVIDVAQLEYSIRDDLNKRADRYLGVLDPLKVVIENYSEDKEETLTAINNPEDESAGTRQVPFSREIYIERGDFMEDPPKKFFRLAPGREVRLRYAYFITCNQVIKDDEGEIVELRATYDPETRGGSAPDGRRVKGTLHWVSAGHALDAEVRLYDRLFNDPHPGSGGRDFLDDLNPDSLSLAQAKLEPALADLEPGRTVQFERLGYFCLDQCSQEAAKPVFNRTVALRDTWAKIEKQRQAKKRR
ncbi:MAG TPA: glutamine--tRNA ligase/YqeY domain fusion protein [Acidobacteriota bacterium]|nr:glutamine--tRNA ligase/YqeY domain fusion protein [Acidobacteriota bacterium]